MSEHNFQQVNEESFKKIYKADSEHSSPRKVDTLGQKKRELFNTLELKRMAREAGCSVEELL